MATTKIAALMIRTLAKPLANSLKTSAANNPTWKRFCISVAQGYHTIEETLKMRFLGYKLETIRPLNEARAVELGTSFLAEFFIFAVAGTVVVEETIRSSLKTSARNADIDNSIATLKSQQIQDTLELQLVTERVQGLELENDALRDAAKLMLDMVSLKGVNKQRSWWLLPGLNVDETMVKELERVGSRLESATEYADRRKRKVAAECGLNEIELVKSIEGAVFS
ncbi:optic atrophy 3 protein-domain-containing protein [Chytriomyces cf. hyalinus JEL632]|nr:optic atrophy 3 protein-domain-containing protein [Chytriomyces cf. hyalinus JEL632]